MTPRRHADWYSVVRAHWQDTTGFLLASREPCLTIRDQELAAVKGRILIGRDPADLASWNPPRSWLLGVLICPDDDLDIVIEWARACRADHTRIWFFLHPKVHHRAMSPWEDAGFSLDQVDTVSSWQELHKLFGLALNDCVYADWHDADPHEG